MLYIPSGRSYYDIHFLENLHVVIHMPSSETFTINFRIYKHIFSMVYIAQSAVMVINLKD